MPPLLRLVTVPPVVLWLLAPWLSAAGPGPSSSIEPATEQPVSALRLVATVAGRDHDRFLVRDERIRILDTEGQPIEAGRSSWRLDGDLRHAADLIHFTPDCQIVRRDPLASPADGDASLDARILLTSAQAADLWGRAALHQAIAVPVWLHQGRIVATAPFALPPDPDRWNTTGTILAIPEGAADGSAALVLWTPRGIARPAPTFRVPQAQAALAAVLLGTPEEVRLAIRDVPNCRVTTRTGSGSLLHIAAAVGHVAAIQELLERGVPPGFAVGDERPITAAARHGRLNAIQALASVGGWERTNPAETAREAAARGHLELATMLLDEHDGWKRWTATTEALAEQAARHGRLDILQRCAATGAVGVLRRVSGHSLIARIHAGDSATLAYLLEHGADARQDLEGSTPLHAAARRGEIEAVRLLLTRKVRVDAPDPEGRTPIMLAARNGHTSIAATLLHAGARTDRSDRSGLQPLHFAVIGGHADAARLLLEHGANPRATDVRGAAPLDLALRLQASACVALLTAHDQTYNTADYATLEGVFALDRADLLEHAVARGWSPAVPDVEGWPLSLIVRHLNARAIRSWLAARADAPPLTPPPSHDALEAPPSLLAPPVSEWFAGGWPQRAEPIHTRLFCVIDPQGVPRFSRTETPMPDDARTALFANLPAWRGRSATRAGRPVPLLITVPCAIPSSDLRVYDSHELDVLPTRIAGRDLVGRLNETLVVIRYEQRQLPGRRDPMTGQYIPGPIITSPVYGTDPPSITIEDAVASLIVEPDGPVSNVNILARATHTAEPARIVLGWRFSPGLRDGQPVRTRLVLRVSSDPSPL